MPPQYLEGNPQDVYAINRAGATFSDALIGLANMRRQQQQFQAQQALQNAYFQLERQKQMQSQAERERLLPLETSELSARTGLFNAQTQKAQADTSAMRDQSQAGGMLGDVLKAQYDTDPLKNPDVMQFLRGIAAQQGGRIAATSPQNISKQMLMMQAARDPRAAQMLAFDQPMTEKVPYGGSLFDVLKGEQIDINPRLANEGGSRGSPADTMFREGIHTILNAAVQPPKNEFTGKPEGSPDLTSALQLLEQVQRTYGRTNTVPQMASASPGKAGGSLMYKGSPVEYDQIPAGEQYTDPNGQVRIKQ